MVSGGGARWRAAAAARHRPKKARAHAELQRTKKDDHRTRRAQISRLTLILAEAARAACATHKLAARDITSNSAHSTSSKLRLYFFL